MKTSTNKFIKMQLILTIFATGLINLSFSQNNPKYQHYEQTIQMNFHKSNDTLLFDFNSIPKNIVSDVQLYIAHSGKHNYTLSPPYKCGTETVICGSYQYACGQYVCGSYCCNTNWLGQCTSYCNTYCTQYCTGYNYCTNDKYCTDTINGNYIIKAQDNVFEKITNQGRHDCNPTLYSENISFQKKAFLDSLHDSSNFKVYVYPSSVGLDSTCLNNAVLLNLSFDYCKNTYSFLEFSTCDSLILNNYVYKKSGEYIQIIPNSAGCDSIISIDLTINPQYLFIENHTICKGETYFWQIGSYKEKGTYTAKYKTINNCDSIYTLNLNVKTFDNSVSVSEDTLTANSIAEAYQWIDCDNYYPIQGEINQTYITTKNGNYAVIITQDSCQYVSPCQKITSEKAINFLKGVTIFPNPVKDELIIENLGNLDRLSLEIINSVGQSVYKENFIEKTIIKTSNFNPGVYLIKFDYKNSTVFRKIVK